MRIGIDNAFVAYCRLARAAILLVLLGLALSGWLLMSGALAVAITRPLMLHSAQFARHLIEQNLQYAVWTTRLFDHYVAAAVIGLVGLLLVLVGRVLRRQADAADELRLIF